MKQYFRPELVQVIGLLVVDGLFFTSVNPKEAPSIMLVVGFVLLIATLFTVINAVLRGLSWYGLPFNRHRRRIAGFLTGYFASLAAMQSIGQLGPRDVVVVSLLTVFAYFYVSYGQKQTERQS